MIRKTPGVHRFPQMMAAIFSETAYVNGELFERDEDNAPVLDAQDYELLEHIRQTGDVAAGSLGWLAPVEAGRFHCGRPGWPGPDKTKPTHYEAFWKHEERTRRRRAKQARIAHAAALARMQAAKKRAEARERREREAEERRKAAVQRQFAAQQATITEREGIEALLDKRNTQRATEIATAARKRVTQTKRAIMAMMRQTYPTVWTLERLAAAVGCPDPDFVKQCCDELVREGVIRQ